MPGSFSLDLVMSFQAQSSAHYYLSYLSCREFFSEVHCLYLSTPDFCVICDCEFISLLYSKMFDLALTFFF